MKRKIRCPICEEKVYFTDRQFLITHIKKKHKDSIPDGWEAGRYENFLRTGKEFGRCMVCKGKTDWNTSTGKYHRLCEKPSCRKYMADKAEQNMVNKTGMTKSERMKQASVQTKMIYAKHTSGCHKVGDHEIWYDSSYGKEFVEMLDTFLNLDMLDVSGPSTNTYAYLYEGEKHMYIPDFVIHSLGLEIEIKDGGDNPNNHPKIQRVDKKKEEEKDKVMERLQKKGQLHYIKIVNKNYEPFFKLLMELREKYDGLQLQGSVIKEESVEFVDESLTVDDTKDLLAIGKRSKGKTSSYYPIVEFYLKKIDKIEKKDAAFWETRIYLTLDQLRVRTRVDKGYDLLQTIEKMQKLVIPKLKKRLEYLQEEGGK